MGEKNLMKFEPIPRDDEKVKLYAEKIALLVSQKGEKMERHIMACGDRNYIFFNKSDPYHSYYKRKLAEYRQHGPPPEACVHDYEDNAECCNPECYHHLLPKPTKQRRVGIPQPPSSLRPPLIKSPSSRTSPDFEI